MRRLASARGIARGIACATVCAIALAAGAARAQDARLVGVTTLRLMELRPLVDDSVPVSATVDSAGELRFTADGTGVICNPATGICRYKRPGDRALAVPIVQDLHVTAWGFGTGVSAVADVRLRAVAGDRSIWPRGEDVFDALAAYVEIDRGKLRTRLGRQWATSSLDTRNFDGLAFRATPLRWLVLDAWGGMSLAPALNETHLSDEIAAVDELPPPERAVLLGAEARVATPRAGTFTGGYLRSIRTDRGALYDERVSAAWTARVWRGGVDASWAADLATGQTNDLRLRLRAPPVRLGALKGVTFGAEGRRYVPFFELWTIWGAFSPVGFDEVRGDATWQGGRVSARAFGGYRGYHETSAGFPGEPMRGDGWRVGGDASVRLAPAWVATGRYALDVGFGASGSDGDAGVRWESPDGGHYVGVHAAAFQMIQELSVGTGFMWGGGVDAGVRLGPDVRLVGDAALYRLGGRDAGARRSDWTQSRATVRVEWSVGGDPGLFGWPR